MGMSKSPPKRSQIILRHHSLPNLNLLLLLFFFSQVYRPGSGRRRQAKHDQIKVGTQAYILVNPAVNDGELTPIGVLP